MHTERICQVRKDTDSQCSSQIIVGRSTVHEDAGCGKCHYLCKLWKNSVSVVSFLTLMGSTGRYVRESRWCGSSCGPEGRIYRTA